MICFTDGEVDGALLSKDKRTMIVKFSEGGVMVFPIDGSRLPNSQHCPCLYDYEITEFDRNELVKIGMLDVEKEGNTFKECLINTQKQLAEMDIELQELREFKRVTIESQDKCQLMIASYNSPNVTIPIPRDDILF